MKLSRSAKLVTPSVSADVVLCVYDTRDGSVAGPIAWALDFIADLHKSHTSLAVIVLRSGGVTGSQIASRCRELGVDVHVLDSSICSAIEPQVEWLLARCRKLHCKVVISNLVLPALFATRWLRRMNVVTIGVMHSNPVLDPFYRDLLDVFVGGEKKNRLDAVVATSQEIMDLVYESAGGTPIRVETIPCGARRSTRHATVPRGELRIVYLGRLVEEQKRIRATTDALLGACDLENVSASICGNGDQEDWLIKRLSGQSRLRYLGSKSPDQVYDTLIQHHVLALLSDYEGLPIALIEAMTCGLVPICMKNASGPAEVIDDQVNGFLVENRQDGFIEAVQTLQDPDVWERMSSAAIQSVSQEYVHEVTFRKWRSLLADLCTSAQPQSALLPFRVNLREYSDRFPAHPQHRPSLQQSARNQIAHVYFQTRQIARPRARLRQLLRSVKRSSD